MQELQNRLLLITFLILNILFGENQMNQNNQIPLEDFFRNPEKASFQLSPNGGFTTYMKPLKDGNRMLKVYIKNINTQEEIRLTKAVERSIYGYFWLNESRIAYIQDKGGDENIHIYAVNVVGSNDIDLTPFDDIKANIIDDLEDDNDYMIVGLNKRDARIHDAYRLNINDGNLELIAENPGNIMHWMTDNDGKLRLALMTDGVNQTLLYRELESDDFKPILTTNFKENVSPLYFTYDNKELYVSSNRNRDKSAIYKFDLELGKETELIFEHDEVDVSGLMRSKKRKKITGVSFTKAKREIVFFDHWRENLQNTLESKLPDVEVAVADLNDDETKAIIITYSDVSRGTYYYYDIYKGELVKLADLSPWLDEDKMSKMEPISYKSRDGLTINGYLTIPINSSGKNLPIVVNPHGGPWVRDYWGFNSEVQYLASKGYAVLQMNYRGSTGYGREFWELSFKQWGKTMQDDITDGVQWLISEGIADPNRVAIYGGSYGGYATLAGLTFTPDLYACGVDYVGVSSLFTFMETFPPYWELYRDMMYEMVGHPINDKELLESASPLLHINNIKVPLFIAQGANDPRVKKSESDQIVKALEEKGVDVPYMVKEDEGHGFYNEKNKFDFYRAMGEFLDKHLDNN